MLNVVFVLNNIFSLLQIFSLFLGSIVTVPVFGKKSFADSLSLFPALTNSEHTEKVTSFTF